MDISYKHTVFLFIRHKLMDWSQVNYMWIIVMFYQLFGLSFWRHPFTAGEQVI